MDGFNELIDDFRIPGLRRAHDHQHGGASLAGKGGDQLAHDRRVLFRTFKDGYVNFLSTDGHFLYLHQFHAQATHPGLPLKGLAHLLFHLLAIYRGLKLRQHDERFAGGG